MIELFLLQAKAVARMPLPAKTLSPSELKAYTALRTDRRREEYLLGRALLKAVLTKGDYRRVGDFAMIGTTLDPGGKPRVAKAEFNLSHDDGVILLAFGDQPVGVDIETVQEFDEQMLRICFDGDEHRRVSLARRPDRAATLAWCRKEAEAKATGAGVLPALGAPGRRDAFTRAGRLRVGGVERAFAVSSFRPLGPLRPVSALPRFQQIFETLAQ